jgi:ATP-dependent RNA helicase DDX3X
MAGWGTDAMAAALPTTEEAAATFESAPEVRKNPQEAGWVAKQSYDYDTYNKSSKELMDAGATGSGLESRAWASNAVRYEWNDEYGDVVPRFEELEKQLFGLEFRPSKGIDFTK